MYWLVRFLSIFIPLFGDLISLLLIYSIVKKSTKRMHFIRPVLVKMVLADTLLSHSLGLGWYAEQYYPLALAKINGFFKIFGKYGSQAALCSFLTFGLLTGGAVIESIMARFSVAYEITWMAKIYSGYNYIFLQILEVSTLFGFSCLSNYITDDMDSLILFAARHNYSNYISTIDRNKDVIFFVNTDFSITFSAALGSLFANIVTIFSFYLLGYITHRKIFSKASVLSPEQKRLQRSLTIMIFIQTSLPIIFLIGPSVVILFTLVLNPGFERQQNSPWNPDDVGWYYDFIGYLCYAPMNSLLTMVVVKPYREFWLEFCRRICYSKRIENKNIAVSSIITLANKN